MVDHSNCKCKVISLAEIMLTLLSSCYFGGLHLLSFTMVALPMFSLLFVALLLGVSYFGRNILDFQAQSSVNVVQRNVGSPVHISNMSTASNITMSRRMLVEKSDLPIGIKKDKEAKSHLHPVSLIKCENQTRCIQPVLQLQKSYNVYYCKHSGHGVRFYYLIREGLLLHPKIRLVETPEAADVVVYLPESAPWHKTECSNPAYRNKTVVLDEGDGQTVFEPEGGTDKVILTFKRSYVRRQNGEFKGYMGYVTNVNILPMTYTMADAYVKHTFNKVQDRDIDILCTLRGSNADPVRLRVRQWVAEYAKARGVTKFFSGQLNSASRPTIDKQYFETMHKSQLIVTANPSGWEGDFRLCEALASGALILVDHMYVPRFSPLVNNQHFVLYDNNNKTDLFEKLDYYRKNKEQARRVAVSGYLHAMKYHRAANLIDYVFRTIHSKEQAIRRNEVKLLDPVVETRASSDVPPPQVASYGYTDTGYQLRINAIASTKILKKGSNIGFK